MASFGTLWFDVGSKYIVDLRNMRRFKKILWCNHKIISNEI